MKGTTNQISWAIEIRDKVTTILSHAKSNLEKSNHSEGYKKTFRVMIDDSITALEKVEHAGDVIAIFKDVNDFRSFISACKLADLGNPSRDKLVLPVQNTIAAMTRKKNEQKQEIIEVTKENIQKRVEEIVATDSRLNKSLTHRVRFLQSYDNDSCIVIIVDGYTSLGEYRPFCCGRINSTGEYIYNDCDDINLGECQQKGE